MALQNAKLVGGDLSYDTLITKEQHNNSQLRKEKIEELVEDKLMGMLRLESSIDTNTAISRGPSRITYLKDITFTLLTSQQLTRCSISLYLKRNSLLTQTDIETIILT